MAANIWRPAGINNNWSNALNWSLLAVPTASDGNTATFDGNVLSGPCTVDGSNRVCNAIDFSAYTNTITMTFAITVSGSVTLGAAMVIAGASGIACNATGTLTSNGKTWPNNWSFAGTSQTYTLADNWTVSGNLTFNGTTTTTLNGAFTFRVDSSLTHTSSNVTGTATLRLGGTGTWSNAAGDMRLALTINTAGTLTISGSVRYNSNTITYTAGTVITTSSTFTTNGTAGTTFNLNGILFNNFTINGSGTNTLSSNLDVDGTLSLGNSSLTTTINGNTINASATVTVAPTTGVVTGTTIIKLDGTGTLSRSSAGELRSPLTINTAGTITLSGTFEYNTGTWTITAGTIVNSSFALTVATTGNTTFTNNNDIWTFTSLTIPANGNGIVKFNGTFGFTISTLTATSGSGANPVLNLAATITYTITTTFTVAHSGSDTANFVRVKSDTGGSKAIFTLNQGATQDVDHCSATDIDSSLGQTVSSYHANVLTTLITNTFNWQTLPTAPKTISFGAFN